MIPLKRRRVSKLNSTSDDSCTASKYPHVVIFLLERKMGTSRRSFLTELGRSKGFIVQTSFSHSVTHIVSENNSGDEVRTWLELQKEEKCEMGENDKLVNLLDISWLTESMREGNPVKILDRHRLQERTKNQAVLAEISFPSYACQRSTPLHGQNGHLTDALSILADNAEFSASEGRGVAFRRAAAVLKCLPNQVTRMEQLRGVPCLGKHSLRVIKDILDDGVSQEVEATRDSAQYLAMKVLTGIFGVGVKTADRWFREGIETLSQLQKSGNALNRAQQAGLQHYEDLNLPVTRAEANLIGQLVESAVHTVLPGAEITLIGGFRRGKQTGHDVDFLITHPEDGKEEGLMPKIVSYLDARGFLLYQKTSRNSYLESMDGPGQPASNMDRFERCFSIFRLPRHGDSWQTTTNTTPHFETSTATLEESRENTVSYKHFHSVKEMHSSTEPHPNIPSTISAHTQSHIEPHTLDNMETTISKQTMTVTDETQHSAMSHGGSLKVSERQGFEARPWRAVRVDLVVSPHSQFAFALLGWTGSKLFERDLRRWAKHEKSMSLSSHALFDSIQGKYLRASSEEDIFAHLGLEYILPSERNA